MRLNSKILSILKESEEENLFKPRRIEPRKEQNKLERNKVENILKYVLDGHVKTILNIFREFTIKKLMAIRLDFNWLISTSAHWLIFR